MKEHLGRITRFGLMGSSGGEGNFLIIRVHRCALASAGVLLAHVIHHLVPLVLVQPEHREREDVLARFNTVAPS